MAERIRTVTVQPGDSLWSIARRELGNGQKWRDIFLANAPALVAIGGVPEKVGPNFIWPGTELVIVDVEFEPSGN